jgi:hypothetical protein
MPGRIRRTLSSSLEIHIGWKVGEGERGRGREKERKRERERHQDGAADPDRVLALSVCVRSAMPGNMVVPPEGTTLPLRSFTDIDVALHDIES